MTLKPLPAWQFPIVSAARTATKEFFDWLKSIDALLRVQPVLFAGLPSSPSEGMTVPITDSNVNTWGSVIAGGGGFHVLGYWNGTAWTVAAK